MPRSKIWTWMVSEFSLTVIHVVWFIVLKWVVFIIKTMLLISKTHAQFHYKQIHNDFILVQWWKGEMMTLSRNNLITKDTLRKSLWRFHCRGLHFQYSDSKSVLSWKLKHWPELIKHTKRDNVFIVVKLYIQWRQYNART